MHVVLWEFWFESRRNQRASLSNAELSLLTRSAIEVAAVKVVAWSRKSINTVLLADEDGVDGAHLPLLLEAWSTAPPRLRFATRMGGDDPSEWDWALPSAERWARHLLAGRHQCRSAQLCLCTTQGVMYPSDAAQKKELGCLVSP